MKKSRLLSAVCAGVFSLEIVLSTAAVASTVIDGSLVRLDGTTPLGAQYPSSDSVNTSVDHVYFTVNTDGIFDFDILSWESTPPGGEPGAPVDLNGDGEIAFFDPIIHLFKDDGLLEVGDLIRSNDDSDDIRGSVDGSINTLDSFLTRHLLAGNYLLAIGSYSLDTTEAIGTSSLSRGPATHLEGDLEPLAHGHGDWRLTMSALSGDITVTSVRTSSVPVPPALWLFGSGLLCLVGIAKHKKAA